jgi:hypothetical protein
VAEATTKRHRPLYCMVTRQKSCYAEREHKTIGVVKTMKAWRLEALHSASLSLTTCTLYKDMHRATEHSGRVCLPPMSPRVVKSLISEVGVAGGGEPTLIERLGLGAPLAMDGAVCVGQQKPLALV